MVILDDAFATDFQSAFSTPAATFEASFDEAFSADATDEVEGTRNDESEEDEGNLSIEGESKDFNSYNYWKPAIPNLEDLGL